MSYHRVSYDLNRSFFLSIFHRILCRLISSHLIISLSIVSRHVSSHFILSYLISRHLIPSFPIISYLIKPQVSSGLTWALLMTCRDLLMSVIRSHLPRFAHDICRPPQTSSGLTWAGLLMTFQGLLISHHQASFGQVCSCH